MIRVVVYIIFLATGIASCGPSKKGLFADKRTEHEKYGDRIREAGFDKTPMGIAWFAAAQRSLQAPLNITLPYKETGYFKSEEPSSSGYIFNARRGDRVSINIVVVPDTTKQFFGDLWKSEPSSASTEHLASIDSAKKIIYDVEEDGSYIMRVQPALLEAVEYTLTINTGPSLAFPVSETGNPRLISFWSDPRDGGARRHEGVDITAKFRTPAVAGADGVVSRVMENRLGGKVIFMRPTGKNYSLYYAHLDSQIVSSGDVVKAGQVLGLVGNTGNAKGTVPHLHFGIYGFGGAVDPLPFVDPRRKEPPPLQMAVDNIGKWMNVTANTRLLGAARAMNDSTVQLKKGSALMVLGATDTYYKVRLPDGTEGFIEGKKTSANKINTVTLDKDERVLNAPDLSAAAVKTVEKENTLEVLGTFGDFLLVKLEEDFGWVNTAF